MNGVGLNGNRLIWRWRRFRRELGERRLRTSMVFRSARTKHKMCPACRSLVPRSAGSCPECGESLHAVRNPGASRTLANLFPGVTTATSLIMLVNGLLFVLMLMAQLRFGESPGLLMRAFDVELMARFGMGVSRPTRLSNGAVIGGEWWRWITPIFQHAGLLHFFFNSYLLVRLGPMAESLYGPSRFWVVYMLCGIGGSLASQLPRYVNTVGASGAIMGLIGLLLVYGYRYRHAGIRQSMKGLLFQLMLFWLLFTVTTPQAVDHLNHAGGFAVGAACAWLIPGREFRSRGELVLWQLLSLALVVLVLFSFFLAAKQARAVLG